MYVWNTDHLDEESLDLRVLASQDHCCLAWSGKTPQTWFSDLHRYLIFLLLRLLRLQTLSFHWVSGSSSRFGMSRIHLFRHPRNWMLSSQTNRLFFSNQTSWCPCAYDIQSLAESAMQSVSRLWMKVFHVWRNHSLVSAWRLISCKDHHMEDKFPSI